MKNPLQTLLSRFGRLLMKSDRCWNIARRLPQHDWFYRQRYSVINKRARRECADLFDDATVLSGPFVGMQYAREAAVGSSLWPKLLGTYESELRSCFDTIKNNPNYRQVVDVGFAEGFYLVGLGRHFASAQLVGFDSEAEAKELCQANAKKNGIASDRLKLLGVFEPEAFRDVLQPESLVVVDCEGYENQVVESLSSSEIEKADWLIETHDHLVGGTTERLKLAFSETHDVTEVTTDENLDTKQSLLPEVVQQRCTTYVQEALVSEGRLAEQKWIFATRKAA